MRPEPPDAVALRVVGLGASAGGFEALQQLIGNVRARSGLAFVGVPRSALELAASMASFPGTGPVQRSAQFERGNPGGVQ